jgi:8-oxo-dGTP pyrophosphatase MutT (NUDIX family)
MGPQRLTNLYDWLEACLRKPLPGLSAQVEMAPLPRPGTAVFTEKREGSSQAGVLVLIFPRKAGPALALTRRSDRLTVHQAQISFPGGRQEAGESLRRTALRETEEELGISARDFRILGSLTPLFIPPTNYIIHPTVAGLSKTPRFVPSEAEVAEVLEVPLDLLLDKSTVRREIWIIRGAPVDVPFFEFQGHRIWGATAMVLAELLHVMRKASAGSGHNA